MAKGTVRRVAARRTAPGYGNGAGMLTCGTFQPDTVTTGMLAPRSDELYVTVAVCDSPGNSVMSLFC
jgi:hypothetical protein